MAKKFFGVLPINFQTTVATWTKTEAANILTLDKTAADNTSVVTIEIPKEAGFLGIDKQPIKSITVMYSVATAALDAAPTAVLNKVSCDATAGTLTRAAVTQTIAFSGTNTVGTAAGTYRAKVSITTPEVPGDTDSYTLAMTFDAGLTTVLKILGVEVETT